MTDKKETIETVADKTTEDLQDCYMGDEAESFTPALQEKDCLLEEANNRLLRLQADFDNFRRRTRQEKEELSSIVAQGILLELLPTLDNFERAMASAATQDAAALLAGVEMIYRQFTQIMEKLGITPIPTVGMQFDPQQHEAVMRVEDADQPDGTIVDELQKGYMARGRVIRPSMVKVVSK